jgi:hypothetical protein
LLSLLLLAKLQIEATLHKDTIHHSSAVSNLTKNKINALSKQPNSDVDSEDLKNPFIVTEEQKEPEPIDFPQHHHHTPAGPEEDLEYNPFIVIGEQKEAPEPPITSLPNRNVLKRPQHSLDGFEMEWAPWEFNTIINNVDIEEILQNVYNKCQKTRPKTRTSLDYGKIDLNNGVILEALGESVKLYFEERIQDYKPKKSMSKEVSNCLKKFNVVSNQRITHENNDWM